MADLYCNLMLVNKTGDYRITLQGCLAHDVRADQFKLFNPITAKLADFQKGPHHVIDVWNNIQPREYEPVPGKLDEKLIHSMHGASMEAAMTILEQSEYPVIYLHGGPDYPFIMELLRNNQPVYLLEPSCTLSGVELIANAFLYRVMFRRMCREKLQEICRQRNWCSYLSNRCLNKLADNAENEVGGRQMATPAHCFEKNFEDPGFLERIRFDALVKSDIFWKQADMTRKLIVTMEHYVVGCGHIGQYVGYVVNKGPDGFTLRNSRGEEIYLAYQYIKTIKLAEEETTC